MQPKKNNYKNSAFLVKTYEILQNSTFENIVSWHMDGIGFVIHNVDKFTNQILPLYFKHSNFASFIRQLNMYGFSKKRSLKSQNYYHHSKFQRNSKDLIKEIQRKIEKKTQKVIKNGDQCNEVVSQQKICSQLSIQLQSKTSPKKQNSNSQIPTQQKINTPKINLLLQTHQSLLNIQLKSCLQILADINQLKTLKISKAQKQELQNVLMQNIQYQYGWLNNIKQKMNIDEKQGKNEQIFETKQSLKQKNEKNKLYKKYDNNLLISNQIKQMCNRKEQ